MFEASLHILKHAHTHRLPITSPHHHLPLNPLHLWLSAPRLPACQSSSYGVTATWDWPTPTKEMLIDKRRQRTACSVSERWAGRWWMMLVSQSVPGLLCCQHGSLQRRCQFIFTSDSNFYLLLKVFFPLKAERKLSAPQREIIALDCGEAQLFCMDFFSQIKRYHLEALSFLKISSPTPGIFLKHEKCFGN